jgi:maltose O-acetyltransferase
MFLGFIFKKLKDHLVGLKKEFQLYKYSKKNNCNLGKSLNFLGPLENISIGEHTTVNNNANFRFTNAKINIGKNCLIARNVSILTKAYNIDNQKNISVEDMYAKDVNIGDNVLSGSNVVIMPGVSIGNNSVVGAGSVVTKDIGDFEVWTGVPAKFIRKRKTDNK